MTLPPLIIDTTPSTDERLENLIKDSVQRFTLALGKFVVLPGAKEWIDNYKKEVARVIQVARQIP